MPLNIDVQQILLHMFNLVLLFGILYVLLYKPVHDFMAKREEEYRGREDKTRDALSDAEKLKGEYEKMIKDAEAELATKRAKLSASAENDREKIISDAHARAAQIVDEARAKAQSEHDRLMARAQSEIAEYVSKAAEKIVMKDEGLSHDFDSFFDSMAQQKEADNG